MTDGAEHAREHTPVNVGRRLSRRRFLGGAAAASLATIAARDLLRGDAAAAADEGAADPGTFSVRGGHLVARSDRMEVVFDGTSGGIRRVLNRETGQELLAEPSSAPVPWRMQPQESESPLDEGEQFTPGDFAYTVSEDGHAATLRWHAGEGDMHVVVDAGWDRRGDIALSPRIVNDHRTQPPMSFTYPILPDLNTLSEDGANDYHVYPHATGYLYRQPFEQDTVNVSSIYPDGYQGCTMQVFGYYEADVGGFYFASYDPHHTAKHLHFGQSETSFEHINWDLRDGASMDLDYPVVVAPMVHGDWYEIAEYYRGWALVDAPWSRKGPKWEQSDDQYARWLHEEVGFSIWAPSGVDWSPWYRFYADSAGTKMHVSPNYDWSATRGWQMGFEGYFPANFHENNVASWEGHYVTPYQNDLFISYQAEDFATYWEPNAQSPHQIFPMSIFAQTSPDPGTYSDGVADPRVLGDVFYFLCPVTGPQKALHVWRDKTLMEQNPFLHGSMYDISWGNPADWMDCDRGEHGHTPGRGRWMIDHFRQNGAESKEAMTDVIGRYAAQGTENIIEGIIDLIDFQQSRVVAGPNTTFEGRPVLGGDPWERPPGEGVELIPFFEAVYHDYGPVIEDGWGQLAERNGEIYYWIASRVLIVFGGVFELNYEYGWPEALPEEVWDGSPPATFTPYDGAYYEAVDPPALSMEKVDFLGEIARVRVGFGNPWLAYGRIARPTGEQRKSPKIPMDFWHTHDWLKTTRDYQGTWDVYQLMEAAWIDPHGRLGLFFVNLSADDDFSLEVDVDADERWGLDLRGLELRLTTLEGERTLGPVGTDNHVRFSVTLQPRKVTLVYAAEAPAAPTEPSAPEPPEQGSGNPLPTTGGGTLASVGAALTAGAAAIGRWLRPSGPAAQHGSDDTTR